MSQLPRRLPLAVATVLVVLAGTSSLAGAQATGNPPPPRSIDAVCPPEEVPATGFSDVGAENLHRRAIDCLVNRGIASGTTSSTYNPAGALRRDQMTTLVVGLIDEVAATSEGVEALPAGQADPFPCDVAGRGNPHEANIAALASAGILTGGPGGRPTNCYGPDLAVTRAQMASFLDATLVFLDVAIVEGPQAAFVDYFVDDDASTHERNINAITSEAIAAGVGTDAGGGDLYRPQVSVRRDQMATFVARTLAYVASNEVVAASTAP